MSEETKLFTPPAKYPDPPEDMWYELPPKDLAPDVPKYIFPWEAHARRATRVFPVEKLPSPEPQPAEEPHISQGRVEEAATSAPPVDAPPSPEGRASPPLATDWRTYSRSNAWDEIPEIERYVQAFAQSRRAPVQVIHGPTSASGTQGVISHPAAEPRRQSMKLTDFPTEIERPSLPVTPAPIKRPSFWSEERDESGELPTAEGVPKQEDWVRRFSSSYPSLQFLSHAPPQAILYWRCQYCGRQNPALKLEELQLRQSEVLEMDSALEATEIPDRQMPESKDAAAVAAAAERAMAAAKGPAPAFVEPSFGPADPQRVPTEPPKEGPAEVLTKA